MSRVVVIGGGVGGAAAALHLADSDIDVVLLEGGSRLGGLVASFEVNGTPLECFYHHVFPHEHAIQRLIDRVGLTPRLEWLESSMGVLHGGRVWPFTSPADLLRFRPLGPIDRVRAGVGSLRLGRDTDWRSLDTVRASAWLERSCGRRVTEVLWNPLLHQKFGAGADDVPAAWMWARLAQRRGARRAGRGGERLGYLRGGFRQLFDALDGELRRCGVDVRYAARVNAIAVDECGVTGVELDDDLVEADAVVYTGPLPNLPRLLPSDRHDPLWTAARSLGAQCVILELDQPLQQQYWVNVCDRSLPFGGVIEHTNLVPAADYGGRHVVYLSRYFRHDEPFASTDPDATADEWLRALGGVFPTVDSTVVAMHTFRTPHAAPLVHLGYLDAIPARCPDRLDGLFLATTAQIYPQDRGMSDGASAATECAAEVAASLHGVVGARA